MAKKIKLTCPIWFDDYAEEEWKRITKILKSEEFDFTSKDIKALEGYCINYSKWKRCEQYLFKYGLSIEINDEGYEQQRPEVSIANKAQQEMRSWMKELCLTPSARARVIKSKASATENYSDDDFKMEKMFND